MIKNSAVKEVEDNTRNVDNINKLSKNLVNF